MTETGSRATARTHGARDLLAEPCSRSHTTQEPGRSLAAKSLSGTQGHGERQDLRISRKQQGLGEWGPVPSPRSPPREARPLHCEIIEKLGRSPEQMSSLSDGVWGPQEVVGRVVIQGRAPASAPLSPANYLAERWRQEQHG